MFASLRHSRARRRGVVLIVVLGMLSLLALIGVTFATFSGQARVNARNFSQSQNQLDVSEVMDYALAQLINDSGDPQSALRGHSLKRDMYGNDAVFNGFVTGNPSTGTAPTLKSTGYISTPTTVTIGGQTYTVTGLVKCETDITAGDPNFYGFDFTRWAMVFSANGNATSNTYLVGETFEIVLDDNTGTDPSGHRIFYVAYPDTFNPPSPPPANTNPPRIANYTSSDPNALGSGTPATNSQLIGLVTGVGFVLDGRYLKAFNGPGLSSYINPSGTQPVQASVYGNFRVNGKLLANGAATAGYLGNPDAVGMDEDYDACDLENWFLAMQSADGQVIIPSFHRPGIIRFDPNDTTGGFPNNTISTTATNDWRNSSADSQARFLRPRAADGHSPLSFPDLLPDQSTGTINYDVDNDGDGRTDSVWLDLGFPALRDSEGLLYKPLFAFMVIGLNGRMPLNTVGNLQLRNAAEAPVGLPASHLGNSPSEVDPIYALQAPNQPGIVYTGTFPNAPAIPPYSLLYINSLGYSQYDNAGLSVNITQTRNLLAGTIPQANPRNITNSLNQDLNSVPFGFDSSGTNLQYYYMPNGVADTTYLTPASPQTPNDGVTSGQVFRLATAVPGRWGEAGFIPGTQSDPVLQFYNNMVRAGISSFYYTGGTPNPYTYRDADDDNFNTFDPTGETFDFRDPAGAWAMPVERMRRSTTPADASGDGMIFTFGGGSPQNSLPGGPDPFGRVVYYKHFRPPGMAINYSAPTAQTYATPNAANPTFPDVATNPLHGYDSFRNPFPPPYPGAGGPPAGFATPSALQMAGMPFNNPNPTTPPTALPTYTNGINSGVNFPFVSANLNEADEMRLDQITSFDEPFGPNDLQWLYRYQDSDGVSLQSRLASLAPISFTNPYDGARRRRMFSVDSWELNSYVWANDNPLPNNAWDQTQYPNGKFAGNATFPQPANFFPQTNAQFLQNQLANASLANLIGQVAGTTPAGLTNYPPPAGGTSPTTAPGPYSKQVPSSTTTVNSMPSLAQRGRKINLNYPLPISNDPNEPIRQKWIMEAYQLCKAVLPPGAVDTPEELAQLSQYLTNVIDFRDPDSTMTHFVNPDVQLKLNPASGGIAAQASSLVYAPTGSFALDQYGMEYNPIAINEVLAYSFQANGPGGGSSPTQVNRFFVELVNTLTESAKSASVGVAQLALDSSALAFFGATPPAVATPNTTTPVLLQGWDMIILEDLPENRPDPNTGDLPYDSGTNQKVYPGATGAALNAYGPILLDSKTFKYTGTSTGVGIPATGDDDVTLLPLRSVDSSPDSPTGSTTQSPYYCVIGSVTNTASDIFPAGLPPNYSFQTGFDPFNGGGGSGLPPGFTAIPPPTAGSSATKYLWLCLRRPANLFDPTGSTKVVVDSIRFIFTEAGVKVVPGSPNTTTPGTPPNYIFSTQRAQPFRGGHAVPMYANVTGLPPGTTNPINPAYGYSEQQVAPATSSTAHGQYSDTNGTVPTTKSIYHSLGWENDNADSNWDYFQFNDRDFTSVVEMALVPGCPPGLFTKQFAELPPSANFPTPKPKTDSTWSLTATPTAPTRPTPLATDPNTAGSPLNTATTPTFPYLIENFWYSGASRPIMQSYTAPATLGGPQTSGPLWPAVNGPDAGGWYKMFEFFEVPSPSFGTIGPVAQGNNYDWQRQDVRPGLLNLNLIIDEEVFLGLMGNAGLVPDTSTTPSYPNATPPALNGFQMIDSGPYATFSTGPLASPPAPAGTTMPTEIGQIGPTDPNNPTSLTTTPPYAYSQFMVPKVVTGGNAYTAAANVGPPQYPAPAAGKPGHFAAYPMSNVGFYANDTNPMASNISGAPISPDSRMKAAFSDFLKMRHGGSGYLFAWGQSNLPPERPFRSLSYPDIDATVLRPAAPPPPPAAFTPATTPTQPNQTATPTNWFWDPGIMNPYITDPARWSTAPPIRTPLMPPPIPTRRLFQLLDENAGGPGGSNADVNGDPFVNVFYPAAANPSPPVAGLTPFYYLTNPSYDLTSGSSGATPSYKLGQPNNLVTGTTGPNANSAGPNTNNPGKPDARYPYFRYDWLQKVTNLTTVRTHQYAVWITVGFFQVIQQGDPILSDVNPSAAMDILGEEIGLLDGRSVRYRAFFIVDRTKAVGFNPQQPGNFRDCVVYRQVIE
jgi:large repetitive protein